MLEFYQAVTAAAALLLALASFGAVLQRHAYAGILMFLTGMLAVSYFATIRSIPLFYTLLAIALSVTGILWRVEPSSDEPKLDFDDSTLRRRFR